jgi:RNA polymerase sigma factor (sigma-70 family)
VVVLARGPTRFDSPEPCLTLRPTRYSGGVGAFDARAVRQLFEQHGPMVYRRALRILGNSADAEEALQEVFMRVLRGAEGFENRSEVTTWLYRITTNYCLNMVRDGKRRRELLEQNFPGDDDVGTDSSHQLMLLRGLLADADEQQALAAIYVYVDGMSQHEAAELLGVSRRTVGNLLERFGVWAKERLRSRDSQPGDADEAVPSSARGGRP